MAAQHVLDCGDVDGRVLLRALLTPGAWRHQHNIKPSVTPPQKYMYYIYKYTQSSIHRAVGEAGVLTHCSLAPGRTPACSGSPAWTPGPPRRLAAFAFPADTLDLWEGRDWSERRSSPVHGTRVYDHFPNSLPAPFWEPFLFFIAFCRISFMETFRLSTGINEKP